VGGLLTTRDRSGVAVWPRLCLVMSIAASAGAAEPPSAKASDPGWLGEEMPLPLTVKTPQDLALKAVAERQYLLFNLLARGKLAWDAGDFATAAAKWEALLRVPGLDPDLEKVVKPLAVEARTRATPAPAPAPSLVNVSGQVAGAGNGAAGGAVVWLRRADGATPRPAPLRGRSVTQLSKSFIPHVMPVTVGTSVAFANEDTIFHNVFSLSRPNDFDGGLRKAGQSYSKTFSKPGLVQINCTIHASMVGYLMVVDTPWYGQADGSGSFLVRGVPPGEYDLEAWHEAAARTVRQRLTVGAEGVRGLTVRMDGARAPAPADKDGGKPPQVQLGN
jgi:plastocyanin